MKFRHFQITFVNITQKEYEKLYKNTVQVAKMMRQGAFMQKAINSLIKMLDEGKKDE